MYVKKENVNEVNFLASAKFLNFTRQISNEGVTAGADGKKIVPAGTVYKNENGIAIGLVFTDVDVTNGPQPGAVMYEGWVIESRLPATITNADKATMTGIHFKDDYESQDNEEYVVTTDTKYLAGKTYYSKSGTTYTALVAGTDYTVGDNITGTVYEAKA